MRDALLLLDPLLSQEHSAWLAPLMHVPGCLSGRWLSLSDSCFIAAVHIDLMRTPVSVLHLPACTRNHASKVFLYDVLSLIQAS